MAYYMQPATVDDAPAIAEVFQKAFEGDHIMGYFYSNTPKDMIWEKDLKYFKENIGVGTLYGERYTKVVEDSTGKIVAFSAWQYPYHLTPEQKSKKEEDLKEKAKEPHPPGAQGPLIEEAFGKLNAGRKKWIIPEKTFCKSHLCPQIPWSFAQSAVVLHILAVHPDHQGKGLGSALIKPGLEEADRVGAQTYIEASPAGLAVYLKYGWKTVDEMVVDMRPYGGQGVEHHPFLMREAYAPKQTGK